MELKDHNSKAGICDKCQEKLSSAIEFRREVRKADEHFKKFSKNEAGFWKNKIEDTVDIKERTFIKTEPFMSPPVTVIIEEQTICNEVDKTELDVGTFSPVAADHFGDQSDDDDFNWAFDESIFNDQVNDKLPKIEDKKIQQNREPKVIIPNRAIKKEETLEVDQEDLIFICDVS